MTHFRCAKQPNARHPRTLCKLMPYRHRPRKHTRELRANVVVTCDRCMVLKDAWLDLPKRKPMTTRRRNLFLAALGYEGWKP